MVLLLFVAGQLAASAPVAQPTPVPTKADPKICRQEPTTGSIMPPKRICHLKSEWAAIDAANGRNVDNFRNRPQPGLSPSGG